MSLRKLLIVAGAAYAGLAIPALAAEAPEGAPKPCGKAVEDVAGDAGNGAKEVDVVGAWFSQEDGKVFGNIQLSTASDTYSGGDVDEGARYVFIYKADDKPKYARFEYDFFFGPYYDAGDWVDDSADNGAETKGKVFKGANGVISIELPAATAKDGAVLTAPKALTQTYIGLSGVAVGSSDQDTTEAGAEAITVGKPCDGAAAGPTTGTTTGALPVTVTKSAGSAKAANKKKQAKVKLTAGEELTEIKLTLKKGKGTVGKGTAATLTGTQKVAVKLSKKVKPGAYVVEISGKKKDGTAGTAKGKVVFKK